MSCTRFNYDNCRTSKRLQEATGPGRYLLNTPGFGENPLYIDDPQVRLTEWGGNLRGVNGGHPIDIDSELVGLNMKSSKSDCNKYNKSFKTEKKDYKSTTFNIDETRASHPAFLYRDLEQTRWETPLFNPQIDNNFHLINNQNSSLIFKDNYVPTIQNKYK